MDPKQRFILETVMLVVGFGVIGVVMTIGSMTAATVVPLILLFAVVCWVSTALVPWRRATRVKPEDRRAGKRD